MRFGRGPRDAGRLAAALLGPLLCAVSTASSAQDTAAEEEATTPEPELGAGPFWGPPWGRPPLLGDWGGFRAAQANRGLTFGLDVTNTYQAVVDGGLDEDDQNFGAVYFETVLDTEKAGLWESGLIEARLEATYGNDVNAAVGDLLGTNSLTLFPEAGQTGEVFVTKLMLTQFLSETFAVFAGRYDGLDSDVNHFAGSRGKNEFLNPRHVWNAVTARTAPYLLNGGGVIVGTPNPFLEERPAFLVAGFGDTEVEPDEAMGDGDDWSFWAEYTMGTGFGGRPGSLLLGASHNTLDVVDLADLPRIATTGQLRRGESDSTAFYANFHHYLHVEPGQDTQSFGYDPNTPLLRGFGLFGRFGVGDEDDNPRCT